MGDGSQGFEARRARRLGMAASVAGHLAILAAIGWVRPDPPAPRVELPPVAVGLVGAMALSPAPELAPPGPPEPAPQPSAQAEPAPSPPAQALARPTPAPPQAAALAASDAPSPRAGTGVSDAQLASAATAASGAPGGSCNMLRRLQDAMWEASSIQAAVASAERAGRGPSGAVLVWDGDWVRAAAQAGDGLAAVREVILVEVAYAPEACRTGVVDGLVAIALNDRPDAVRLVLGGGRWRWSDVLFPRGFPSQRAAAGAGFRPSPPPP